MTNDQSRRLGEFLMSIRPAPLAAALKILLRVRRLEITTPDGVFWIDPGSYMGLRLLQHGVYEAELLATVKTLLHPGDTFVDVGANEGYFSVVASCAVGSSGRVLAIEPQSRLGPVLKKNLALNGCTNVLISAMAVSDRQGRAELYLTPSLNNGASSIIRPTKYPLFRQTITTATLEELLDQYRVEQCALMKIDIEGWEYEAVLGSRQVFRSGRVRALALELHPHLLEARGLDINEITNFLFDCGYREIPGQGHLLLVHDA